MSIAKKVVKQEAVLNLSKKPTSEVIARSKSIVQEMTGNTYFPSPSPGLSTVSSLISKLEGSYALSLTKVKGSVAQANADKKVLLQTLKPLAGYVETIANQTPDNAAAIILTAGMFPKKHAVRQPKVLTVKQGPTPGVVLVDSKAQRGCSYIYQFTTDQTLASGWTDGYKNSKVKGAITGLTPGTRYFFRVATVSTKGESAWSPVVVLVVN